MLRTTVVCLTLGLAVVTGCTESCPASESISVRGAEYCGEPCSSCDGCGDGFTCTFEGGRGICVDDAFLRAQGASTLCEEPCPTGEVRYDDMGTSTCVRVCSVDGECGGTCCFEPSDVEFMICAPRTDLCP